MVPNRRTSFAGSSNSTPIAAEQTPRTINPTAQNRLFFILAPPNKPIARQKGNCPTHPLFSQPLTIRSLLTTIEPGAGRCQSISVGDSWGFAGGRLRYGGAGNGQTPGASRSFTGR